MKVCRKKEWLIGLTALFGAALFVYSRTLCPTVYWEDSGELIAVSYVLGIPHPPGHPLYAILGRLFTLLPWGSIAQRVNFMSAFFGALAASLVYPAVLMLLRAEREQSVIRHCAGATAALFAAFGVTLWDQAVVAETSTLHAFFFILLVCLFLRLLSAHDEKAFYRSLFFFCFVYGLSLTNHVAGVFAIPAFVVWAWVSFRGKQGFLRKATPSVFFFLLGLSVYLYLPIRSAQDPVIDWGNPESFRNFLWVVTASQFKSDVFGFPARSEIIEIAAGRLSLIRENYMALGLSLMLIGIWRAFRNNRNFLLFSATVVATLFIVTLNPSFITAYFIPALLLLAVFIGLGAYTVVVNLVLMTGAPLMRRVSAFVLCFVLLLSPVLPLARHYPVNDRSDYYRAREYGMRILALLPPNALFFTIDLNAMFVIWYLMHCEGIREDVMVVEPSWLANSAQMREEILRRYPELLMPATGERMADAPAVGSSPLFDENVITNIMRMNAELRPVFWGAAPVAPHSMCPQGLVYEFVGAEQDSCSEQDIEKTRTFWEEIAEEFRENPELASDRMTSLLYPENLQHQSRYFALNGRHELAEWAARLALELNPAYAPAWLRLAEVCEDREDREKALACLDQAARLDVRLGPRAHYKKSLVFYSLGRYEAAANELSQVIREAPAYPNANNMLGAVFLVQGRVDMAEMHFREELRHNPQTTPAYSNLAQILIQKNRFDEAESLLKNGIEADHTLWQNYYFLSQLCGLCGRNREAEEHLAEAVRLGGEQVLRAMEQNPYFRNLRLETNGGGVDL